ncbi:MAG: hypothetical protein Q9M31_04820, partial [Mariprofundus sp.]|nr:hypothetical protein [Mariprofundus sp.]
AAIGGPTLAQPALLFAPWNHHAPHSTSKMDSKWDCRSSTQSFAIGSCKYKYYVMPLIILFFIQQAA